MTVLFNDNLKIISMDDKAKVKVGGPAVSKYHRLKRLFPSSDNPNYSDHDFPVSGYFLNISGYMELDSSEFASNTSSEFLGLDSASVDNQQSVPQNDDIHFSRASFLNMDATRLFDCLFEQAKLHLNVNVNYQDCVDVVCKEIEDHPGSYENGENTVNALRKQVDFDIDVLRAFSAVFKAKIIVYKKSGEIYQQSIIEG